MLQLALKHKKVDFLNNDKIYNMMQNIDRKHEWFINATQNEEILEIFSFDELFNILIFEPFRFYFSIKGYQWIYKILFIEYYIFISIYLFIMSINDINDKYIYLEIILWIFNIGYIIDGLQHLFDNMLQWKNPNVIYMLFTIIWIVLGCIRISYAFNATINYNI